MQRIWGYVYCIYLHNSGAWELSCSAEHNIHINTITPPEGCASTVVVGSSSSQASPLAQGVKRGREPSSPSSPSSPCSPLTPRTDRAYQHLKDATELGTPESQAAFQKVRKRQRTLEGHSKLAWDVRQPARMLVMPDGVVHVVKEVAGKGAQAEAFFTQRVSTRTGTPPKPKVVKFARRPFTPQKEMMRGVSGEHVDIIHRTGATVSGTRFAVFDRSAGDITSIAHHSLETPVASTVSQFAKHARGIQALHDQDLIHCDIKGANLLYGPAKVTDTGLLREAPEEGEEHLVAMTPNYTADWTWTSILNQRVKRGRKIGSIGHQSKEGDVFSFGFTIERDGVRSIIRDLSEKYQVDNPLDIAPKRVFGPFSDDELLQAERENAGRVIYVRPNPVAEIGEYILIYPTRDEALEKTLAAIEKLKPHHPSGELGILTALATLAHNLQGTSRAATPSIEAVIMRLDAILPEGVEQIAPSIPE